MPFFIIGSDSTYLYGIFDIYKDYTAQEIEALSPMLKYLIKNVKLQISETDNPIVVKLNFKL